MIGDLVMYYKIVFGLTRLRIQGRIQGGGPPIFGKVNFISSIVYNV